MVIPLLFALEVFGKLPPGGTGEIEFRIPRVDIAVATPPPVPGA